MNLAQAFSPSTQQTEADRFLNLRPTWSTKQVLEDSQGEIQCLENKKQQ